MSDRRTKEEKVKVVGVREGLRSSTFLTPDQAELATPQRLQSAEDREERLERDESASSSDEEMEEVMCNVRNTMSLLETSETAAAMVQTKSTSQAVRFDEEELVDQAPNEHLDERESLPVTQLDARMDDETARLLEISDRRAREIIRQFDARANQIIINIKAVYNVMEGAKAYSKLVQAAQMQVLRDDLSNNRYIISDGLLDITTDVRKILASEPFAEALIDEQMNTVFGADGEDNISPIPANPTQDARHRTVYTGFGFNVPPGMSVLPLNEPGILPMTPVEMKSVRLLATRRLPSRQSSVKSRRASGNQTRWMMHASRCLQRNHRRIKVWSLNHMGVGRKLFSVLMI